MSSFAVKPWTPPAILPPGTIAYHYTDATGLKGILENGCFWATEAAGLNDSSEVRAGKRWIKERAGRLGDAGKAKAIEIAADQVVDASGPGPSDVFVLSASLRRNDVGQWRAYGGNSLGYCLGINTSLPLAVRARRKPKAMSGPGSSFSFAFMNDMTFVSPWSRVLYDEADREEAFANLVDWFSEAYAEARDAPRPDPDSGEPSPTEDVLYHLSRAVGLLARCIKEDEFRGEEEVRVLASFLAGDRHAHFRASSFGIVRYVELVGRGTARSDSIRWKPSSNSSRLPVASVTVGPKSDFELGAPSLRSFLTRSGFGTDVSIVEVSSGLR